MSISHLVKFGVALILIVISSYKSYSEELSSIEVVKRSEVKFIPLNPLRGKAGPQSGKLWGNIREDLSSGMIVQFKDGFESPPHIHNITYRAVVISGFVHNDDPKAAKMWMGPGSFWTQPLGETHITAAKGQSPLIFLEILSGPYLVKPSKEEFDSGERPINLDARNVIWLSETDTSWIKGAGLQLAYLWGKTTGNEKNGTFVKLPTGFKGLLKTSAMLMRAVTIQGTSQLKVSGRSKKENLEPGSYFRSKGTSEHELSCVSAKPCILYIHSEGNYFLKSL